MKINRLIHQCWILYLMVLSVVSVSMLVLVIVMTQSIEHTMEDANRETLKTLVADIKDHSNFLLQANTLICEAAKVLNWEKNLSSFFNTESKIVPQLYMPFAMQQWVAQISYIELQGFLFSYYREANKSYVLFSNTSQNFGGSVAYTWCSQALDGDTSELYGKIICSTPRQLNDSSSGKIGRASVGVGWGNAREQMLIFTAPVTKNGILSLGVSLRNLRDLISRINLQGGYLYLAIGGYIIAQDGPPHTHFVYNNNMMSIQLMDENHRNVLKKYNFSCHDKISIWPSRTKYLGIWGKRYQFGCSVLDASGIQLAYGITFPYKEDVPSFQKKKIVVILLVLFMILGTILGSYVMLHLLQRSQLKETFLQANLIKQKEALQQAERKSMNKSLAFANASHDIRTSLAGITGLIEICRSDTQDSQLYRNMEQMDSCVSKLLGLLNSVLDISKIEAGKMQLEEVEFDIAQVLEESVDIFHVVGVKKGLEVIWDPCDFSILTSTNVKGDCRRLKQIIDNLLGNAVKFTSKGHVVMRAWAKKPSLQNLNASPKHCCNFRNAFKRWISKDRDDHTYLGSLIQNDHSFIEIVIEVDDTGMGIPKEKRASVFENYVQVKELSSREHEGTGLGLGIVQSYVRLMGGEIKIQDKNPGERGTCFSFNILLKSSETTVNNERKDDKCSILPIQSHFRQTFVGDVMQSNVRALAFKRGSTIDGIHSILLVQGDETKRILQRWMEGLGVKVWMINHWELLYLTLEKIKDNFSISGKSESTPFGNFLNIAASTPEIEADKTLPLSNEEFKNGSKGFTTTYALVVIDLNYGNFSEIALTLKNFTTNSATIDYKVVWFVNSNAPSDDLRRSKQVPCDLILQKPIHGSRLYEILRLLQDFGKANDDHTLEVHHALDTVQNAEPGSSMEINKPLFNSTALQSNSNVEVDKPLTGMNVLLVEDTYTLRHIATTMLSRLGANVQSSEDGSDALNLIRHALREFDPARKGSTALRDSKNFRYDVVLMDCEMPIMNGYEATRQIRQEERSYGLHIPIIALTAHATVEEERKTMLSGMDFHLTKPLQVKKLVDAIATVCGVGNN